MEHIPFTVSARTARLIGRENVANAEGALIELVKNCYDADSPIAIVVVDKAKDTILIVDGGEGMTDNIIKEQWMTIGTDDKLTNPITSTGRIKAGAKGIGRFALDRLGGRCTMITFPSKISFGFKWTVDWASFEERDKGRNKNIDEVFATMQELKNTSYKKELLKEVTNLEAIKLIKKGKFEHGTLLKITGLRDEWKGNTISKIYESLELLTPPDGEHKIEIWFISGSEPGKFGIVENNEFVDYDYKVVATYKKNKDHLVNVSIHRNEFSLELIDKRLFDFPDMKESPYDKKTFRNEHFSLKKSFSELIKGYNDHKKYADEIGNFQFTFYFLKNQFSGDDREKYKYKDFLGDRKAWLKKFGGIKLYRDNFRIRPYGENNTQAYDWLMLGERQAQNPAAASRKGGFRVGPNQVAGLVKFSRITNPALEDKSSREGLQENEVFALFKNLLLGIIKIQEDDRSTIFANLSELFSIINDEQNAIDESEKIANEEDKTSDDETEEETKAKNRTLKRGIKAINKKLADKDDEIAISRAMATAGIMIASFSHEFHGIKNDLGSRTHDIKKYLSDVIDKRKLANVVDRKNPLKLLDELQKEDEKIKQWIEFAIGLTHRDRRRNKIVSLLDYFKEFTGLWFRMFEERGVVFKVNSNDSDKNHLKLKISELDLDTIFDNLLTNSIEAFERNGFGGRKIITIELGVDNNRIVIKYRDTGPGIDSSYININEIFNPFETSKRDDLGNEIGTGLGMWLVKSAIDSNNGYAELHRPKIGFEMHLFFKIKLT